MDKVVQPAARALAVQQPGRLAAFTPKLLSVFQEGYGLESLKADVMAGLTVAVVAMPLSMALAIASGVGPERGLFTAVVAGFLISALGGSRHQIGGPTGAFVVVVSNVVARFGYDGLVVATLMAGIMLMAAGAARLGTFVRYIPYPVVTGFTSGIALIIFSSQIGDLLGLTLHHVPGDVLGKWQAYFASAATFRWQAIAVAFGTLAGIVTLQRLWPRAPAFLFAMALAAAACWAFDLPIQTIFTRFGAIPNMLPLPHWPSANIAELRELLPSAFTIFLLGGIESLLSAVVADGMTGRRHRSNGELVAQGVANIASACMGGIPATGAIARTATNIRAGARTPVAGMVHAAAVLAMMIVLAPLVSFVPLAALAAVLVTVCWNMAEFESFRTILRAPRGDMALLLVTFALTILADLSVAIGVGVVLSSFLFMHRMARTVEAQTGMALIEDDAEQGESAFERQSLPPGVEVFRLSGPFFFGAAAYFEKVLAETGSRPRVVVLRMDDVPLIDATGAMILKKFFRAVRARGTRLVLSGVREGPAEVLAAMQIDILQAPDHDAALEMARGLSG
ncbi:MAG TPA: sulfate permease [Rhizomicrobium sp.]|jgi:SulP family sulfate permease|nr:sulfate permease [Rhizomicrobium sp.]